MPNVPVQAPPNPQYRFPSNAAHTTTVNIRNGGMAYCQMQYVPAIQNTSPRPQGQPPTQEERNTMQAHIKELLHHPDTTGGQVAYVEQVQQ